MDWKDKGYKMTKKEIEVFANKLNEERISHIVVCALDSGEDKVEMAVSIGDNKNKLVSVIKTMFDESAEIREIFLDAMIISKLDELKTRINVAIAKEKGEVN